MNPGLKVTVTSIVEQMATKRFNPKCSLRLHRRINPEQEGLFRKPSEHLKNGRF